MIEECSRCLKRVDQAGDHLCADCGKLLGRPTTAPYWGAFANHPDALGEIKRGNDFIGALDGMLRKRA
jgi:hypothetical protein